MLSHVPAARGDTDSLMLALTHRPSDSIVHGQRTWIEREPIDPVLLKQQHASYRDMLADCGATVRLLDCNLEHPDCAFIEDTAVVLDEVAVMCSMGADSRCAEPVAIENELARYRPVDGIRPPGTLEGGDVLVTGRRILVGRSSRTNDAGIRQFTEIAGRYGYRITTVPVTGCLHLKTACAALPDGRLLINPEWIDTKSLNGFHALTVPNEEPWSANVLVVNGTVCTSRQYTRCNEFIASEGLTVKSTDTSEFARAEGGVTCLSLLLAGP